MFNEALLFAESLRISKSNQSDFEEEPSSVFCFRAHQRDLHPLERVASLKLRLYKTIGILVGTANL